MLSLTKLITVAALATVGFADIFPGEGCLDALLVREQELLFGDQSITYRSHSCGPSYIPGFGIFDFPPLCYIFDTCIQQPPPPPPPKNVCGVSCETSCNNTVGTLPPVTDDCQSITDSLQVFQEQLNPTFVVAPGHVETLTFGTCNLFFQNLGLTELIYCWSDLSTQAQADEAACFPPVHPPFSEGLCTSSDGTWAVGASHS
ncbi:hypothetical protein K439DRAFT_936946 [Ramaria rubella]|nr:hypothetical protein K439DRAFT_936946 [Ramaria rubella]